MAPAEHPVPPRCPVCARPATERYRPFCGRRCANVDLGRWLGGAYVIATDEPPDEAPGEPPGEPPGEADDP